MTEQTAKGRYLSHQTSREPFLTRARDAALLTIPALFPAAGHTGSTKLVTPWQSLGARGVNNLSSKLLLALMPPNEPFFKLAIDDYTLEQMTQQEGMRAAVEEALGKIERTVKYEIEAQAIRVSVSEGLKQLIIAGNVLLYLAPEGGLKSYKLDRYVVRRDTMGNVLEIIVVEDLAPESIPDDIKETMDPKDLEGVDKTIELYTHVLREGKKWKVYQEVMGQKVKGSEGSYPLEKSPWIPLRFTKIDGEDYGRGYVEEYYGDLKGLEALSKAIVEGTAAAAKVLFLVRPNGVTQIKTLTSSPNGAVRSGDANDVTTLQANKAADFQTAFQLIGTLEQRLGYAFMLNTSIQRPGERVTAEEIRYMAGELEDALGGVYSILSLELQLPLVTRMMYQLEKSKKIPSLPRGTVRPTITTGLEALGRGHDLNRLNVFMSSLTQMVGPEKLSEFLNVSDLIKRIGTANGIDMKGLIKSKEEIDAEKQAAMEAAQQQQMQGDMTKGGIDMAKEVVKGGMQQ